MNSGQTQQHVIDRLEGEVAVVEGLGHVPRAMLPEGATEGDVLIVSRAADGVHLTLSPQARDQAERQIQALRARLKPLPLSGDGPLEL